MSPIKSDKSNLTSTPRRHASLGKDVELLALGKSVRAKRIAAKLTQDQLSLVSGVSRDTVMALENGRGSVSLGNALRLLKALGLDFAQSGGSH